MLSYGKRPEQALVGLSEVIFTIYAAGVTTKSISPEVKPLGAKGDICILFFWAGKDRGQSWKKVLRGLEGRWG